MKNFFGAGDVVYVPAPYAVASGDPVWVQPALFGFAGMSAAAGVTFALHVVGEFTCKKASAETWAPGAAIYFDNDLKVFTTANVSGGLKVGVCIAAAASGVAVGYVRLNGSY
jgi:predicted RecA/RadA family phage recombinase